MADLRELTTDAKRLYEALDYLLEEQDKASADDIDLKEICFSAKARPFTNHGIEKLDAQEAKNYLLFLGGLIALAEDADKRKMQLRFLARIIAAYPKTEFSLQDIMNDALLMQEKNLDALQELKGVDTKITLLVDLLLLVYLDENISDRQLDYAVGTMAFLGLKREMAGAVGNAAKGILEQKDARVLVQSEYIDISGLYCYLQNPPDGVLVNDLEKAKAIEAKKIIFTGMSWEGIPTIDIDTYKAEIVEFSNCTFDNIQGIRCISENRKLILKDCSIAHCEAAENLFIFRNTEIVGCTFTDLKSYASECLHLFYLLDCNVTDSQFKDIKIQHKDNAACGGVLKCKSCVFKANIFENIVTLSHAAWNDRRVFDIVGGRLWNCEFNQCTLTYGSYLLTLDDTAKSQLMVKKIKFIGGGDKEENTNYKKNGRDLPLEKVFKGEK